MITTQILSHLNKQADEQTIRDRLLARESKDRYRELATLFRVQQRQRGKYGHLTSRSSMQDEEMNGLLRTGSFYDKRVTGSSHQDLSDTKSLKDLDTRSRVPIKIDRSKINISKSHGLSKQGVGGLDKYEFKISKGARQLPRMDSQTASMTIPMQLVVLGPPAQLGHLPSESSDDQARKLKSQDLSKDVPKEESLVHPEGPLGPIEISRINHPTLVVSPTQPKKKVATINSIDDYSFASHAPSQRQMFPLKGAMKVRPSILEPRTSVKMALGEIKEQEQSVNSNHLRPEIPLHRDSHRLFGDSNRRISMMQNRLVSQSRYHKKLPSKMYRSSVELEAMDNNMSSLRTNLEIMRALLPLATTEFMDILGTITRNNPCCHILGKFLNTGVPISSLKAHHFASDKNMKQNLPLMLADIKEYLIERRVSLLENLARSYLSNTLEPTIHTYTTQRMR